MSCNHPFKGFDLGTKTPNGKREILLYPSTCGNLVSIESASKRVRFIGASAPVRKIGHKVYLCDPVPIPCGSCSGCRMDKAREWRDRIVLESQGYGSEEVWFFTLTYSDACLPRASTPYGAPTLRRRDVQLFLKRLRKYTGEKLRFFCSGEYGSLTKRPHYHFILFGKLDVVPNGGNSYRSEAIEKCWKFGLYDLQIAEPGSIAYTAGYVEKKQLDPNYGSYPVKPFLLMSRRPGIGARAIKPLQRDFKVYGDFGSTHSAPIPQYFKKKLENDPLFAEFSEYNVKKGRDSAVMASSVYGTSDEDVIGLAKDAKDVVVLKNKIKGETF